MDPLILYRNAIEAKSLPSLTTSSDPSIAPSNLTESFLEATHLYFPNSTPQCIALTTSTRFIRADSTPLTLGGVYFAYHLKDQIVNEYIAIVTDVNANLSDDRKVQSLPFIERLDLLTWLESGGDSEFIKPLEGAEADLADAAKKAANVAGGTAVPTIAGTGVPATHAVGGRPTKVIDARLQEIYNGERRMGDHNTVLRGIKPTDFSHVRKHAAAFLDKRRQPNMANGRSTAPSANLPSRTGPSPARPIAQQSAVGSKRSDPIILLSPSASSLLRMSNIKSFLDTGVFVPPDHPTLSSQTTANLLHITRPLKSLSERPYRFILVDSPEQFKPDYWSRVVAVFTTGQTWQFRSYKWREPQELFGHVLGIYVGEKSTPAPDAVKGWGSSVKCFEVDRWDERAHGANVDLETRKSRRWRDQEAVEEVWRSLENYMRGRGEWRK